MAFIPGRATLTLTAPVVQQNITRLDLLAVKPNDVARQAIMVFSVNSTPGNGRGYEVEIQIANGSCQGLMVNPTPSKWDDIIIPFPIAIATGYDQLDAAFTGGSPGIKLRAALNWAISAGLLPGLAGTVS